MIKHLGVWAFSLVSVFAMFDAAMESLSAASTIKNLGGLVMLAACLAVLYGTYKLSEFWACND